jgi:hypothetical protein
LGNGKQFPVPSDASILIAPQLALAAIAAAFAFLAPMVGAAVFGAVDANVRGWLVANAARERSYFAHKIYFA